MNYIEFNGNKIPVSDLSTYKPQTQNEDYIVSFVSGWINQKLEFQFHTSGSTGEPKPILLKRRQLQSSAEATIKSLNLISHSTCLLCINPKFIGGSMMLVRALLNNMNIIFKEPSSNPLVDINESIEFAAFVPLQVSHLIENEFDKFNSIKKIIIGGGAINPQLESKLTSCTNSIYSTYGMTETSSHIALKKLKSDNSYFEVLPNISISLDNRGCLVINGEVTDNQDIVTNDLVDIIEQDKFVWLGRIDNIINSGGIKINAEKLEAKIFSLFNTESINRGFFITGVENEKFGQMICLVIEGSEEIQNIESLLRSQLDKYEVPKEIIYRNEFVLTPTGKINKEATLKKHG